MQDRGSRREYSWTKQTLRLSEDQERIASGTGKSDADRGMFARN